MPRPPKPSKEKLTKNDVNALAALLSQKGLDKSKHGDPLLHAENKQKGDIIGELKTWILLLSKDTP